MASCSAGQRKALAHCGKARHARTRVALRASLSGSGTAQVLADETGRNPLASSAELSLLGKRIIVTAPRQYAHKLCAKLVNAGARPLWVPGVQITALPRGSPESQQLDQVLQRLLAGGHHGFTHIAFTSKNGIFAVLQRLAELAGGVESACEVLRGCGARLCALGADGEVLLRAGLPLHVSPPEASTQGLVKELVSRGEASGATVLCPVPHVTGGLDEPPVVPRFVAALLRAGASPVRVPAYVTCPGTSREECAAELQALQQGQVTAIAFSSTAEAQGLLAVMGGDARAAADVITRNGVILAAHGPYTAEGASQVLGLPVSCVSKDFKTFDGLVAALEHTVATRSRGTSSSSSSTIKSTSSLQVLASSERL